MSKQPLSTTIKNLDEILSQIIWCENGRLTNLTSKLAMGRPHLAGGDLGALSVSELRGAFACLQIRRELFAIDERKLAKDELAALIKNLIFAELKERLQAQKLRKKAA